MGGALERVGALAVKIAPAFSGMHLDALVGFLCLMGFGWLGGICVKIYYSNRWATFFRGEDRISSYNECDQ